MLGRQSDLKQSTIGGANNAAQESVVRPPRSFVAEPDAPPSLLPLRARNRIQFPRFSELHASNLQIQQTANGLLYSDFDVVLQRVQGFAGKLKRRCVYGSNFGPKIKSKVHLKLCDLGSIRFWGPSIRPYLRTALYPR